MSESNITLHLQGTVLVPDKAVTNEQLKEQLDRIEQTQVRVIDAMKKLVPQTPGPDPVTH